MRFLVDTNVISEIRKRDRANANVIRWVQQTPAEEIGTSVLVLAEIRRGIELKRRIDALQAKSLDRWFSQVRTRLADRVLPIDEAVAETWALLGIPNPLPLIDSLLAATAKLHGLTLVTREWFYRWTSGGWDWMEWTELSVKTAHQRELVRAILKRIRLAGEETAAGFRIYGYVRNGEAADYIE